LNLFFHSFIRFLINSFSCSAYKDTTKKWNTEE
jgi:hypothetical protein